MNKVYVSAIANKVSEEEIRSLIPPAKARRLGMLQKRALATALKALAVSGIEKPDMILNGTVMGCIETSLRILDGMASDGEKVAMPTAFMQSTHNTVASLIAIHTGNHGYNATYSHGAVSFECALQDAFLSIRSGQASSALVCRNDEITPLMRQNPKFFGNVQFSDVSEAWVLTANRDDGALFEIEDIVITHRNGTDSAEIVKSEL
ncbi:MAG: beta-ketoacyl synthase chain length factor [Bacteroidales bacterium]|nr:beta-ketoacyl synthase chain length factor [Bacteroidales bacterium]